MRMVLQQDGKLMVIAPIEDITLASSDAAVEISGNLATAISAGNATISATITEKPEIDANILVAVN